MITKNEFTQKLIIEIWLKTHKSSFITYILDELENDDNVKKMLDFIDSNPDWNEVLMTKHALHIAGIKGFEGD